MGRSRLPLLALLGAVGCTKQDAADPQGATPADDSPPWKQKGARPNVGDEQGKGSSIRALTPEERERLVPPPIPEPEGTAAPAAQADEESDAGTPPDYAEQRRLQLAKDRLEAERIRKEGYRKGSGITHIKRSEMIHIIRDTDGGTPDPVKTAPVKN